MNAVNAKAQPDLQGAMPTERPHLVSELEKIELLRFSRDTAAHFLTGSGPPLWARSKMVGEFGGAFVTFRLRENLRGCVGSFTVQSNLVKVIKRMTQASLMDPRFKNQPITAGELADLTIEISILSRLERCPDPFAVLPGIHGIVIRKDGRSGCFLPQVAVEHGWSTDEFLTNCCTLKAGLPAGSWKALDTELLWFTADSFDDSNVH